MLLTLAIYITILRRVCSIPVKSFNKGTPPVYPQEAIDYLKSYKYLTLNSNQKASNADVFKGMLELQNNMHLQRTGTYNRQTKDLMTKPRCGEKDSQQNLPKDFLKNTFTYFIVKWSNLPGMTQKKQNSTIRLAFYSWRETLLRRVHLHWDTVKPDFTIIFIKDKDSVYLNSIGKTQNWLKIEKKNSTTYLYLNVNSTKNEFDLYQIAKHAFGHSFGRGHKADGSIMSPILTKDFPYHRQSNNTFVASIPVTATASKSTVKCKIKIKSIHNEPTEPTTYILTKDRYWEIKSYMTPAMICPRTVSTHHPVGVSKSRWPEPHLVDVDEGFLLISTWDTTFYFKGSLFYRVVGGVWDNELGKNISDYWNGVPDHIDAAFSLKADFDQNIMYFTKGDLVYQFSIDVNKDHKGATTSYGKVVTGFPKTMNRVFPRLPPNIDSAFRSYCEGFTFFFKDDLYWRWNDKTLEADGPSFTSSLIPGLCM